MRILFVDGELEDYTISGKPLHAGAGGGGEVGLCVSVLLCHPLSSHLNNLLSQHHVSTLCTYNSTTCTYNVHHYHVYEINVHRIKCHIKRNTIANAKLRFLRC